MRLNEEFELIHDPKYQSEKIKLGLRNSLSNEALISQTQTLWASSSAFQLKRKLVENQRIFKLF